LVLPRLIACFHGGRRHRPDWRDTFEPLVRERDDPRRRAEILLKVDDLRFRRIREPLPQFGNYFYFGAAKPVDRLPMVTDRRQTPARLHQEVDQLALHGVDVLHFVDYEMDLSVGDFLTLFRVRSQASNELGLRRAEIEEAATAKIRVVAGSCPREGRRTVRVSHVSQQSRRLAPFTFRFPQLSRRMFRGELDFEAITLVELV